MKQICTTHKQAWINLAAFNVKLNNAIIKQSVQMLSQINCVSFFTVYLDDSRALVSSLFDFLSIFDDTQHGGRRIDVLQFLRTVRTLGTLCWGSWAKRWAGTGRAIWHPTSASRWPVIKWSSQDRGRDTNYSPGLGVMSSQVDNDDTPLSSSRASVPSSSTKYSSNEAKQSSSGPGHPLSFVEIQSFEKIWQLDRVN